MKVYFEQSTSHTSIWMVWPYHSLLCDSVLFILALKEVSRCPLFFREPRHLSRVIFRYFLGPTVAGLITLNILAPVSSVRKETFPGSLLETQGVTTILLVSILCWHWRSCGLPHIFSASVFLALVWAMPFWWAEYTFGEHTGWLTLIHAEISEELKARKIPIHLLLKKYEHRESFKTQVYTHIHLEWDSRLFKEGSTENMALN